LPFWQFLSCEHQIETTSPMNDDVAALTDLSRIRHHFARADVEVALAYQIDDRLVTDVAQSLFLDQEGGLVLETGSAPAFVGFLLAALAQQSLETEAVAESFLKDVSTDVRIAQEYHEGRRRLVANNGKSL
jgi:hypothetical protein